GFILTETLFGFTCALAMLVCVHACKSRSTGWAIVAGLLFGIATLVNTILLPFATFLALFLAWRGRINRRVCAALVIASLLLPGLWFVRNSQLPKQDSAQTSTDRALVNLVQGSWPDYYSAYRASVYHSENGKGARELESINRE